jgi:outer membrane scaffolding protein for murein synthesis (MipA/OmpV family)
MTHRTAALRKYFPVVMMVFLILVFEQVLAGQQDAKQSMDNKPLWEVGVGGFWGWLPDYPAASEYTARSIAVPYLVYRGEYWRVGDEDDRGAVSRRLLKNDRFELDLTFSAAFPVDSGDNDARDGMPDLDYLFGIGPQLIFKLINEPGRRKLNLNLQTRAVYSTDFSSLKHQGYVFNPKLNYTQEHITDLDLEVSARLGPIFATEKMMDYFYQVGPEFATFERPAYNAKAGYLGSYLTLGVTKRFNSRFRLFVGTQIGIHNSAANTDSPLFEDELNLSIFSAFSWTFIHSDQPAR